MTDMLLTYGFCRGNGRKSVRTYHDMFPNRRIPNHQTFARIERRLRETGSLAPYMVNCGHPRTIRTSAAEEQILERINGEPSISCRRLCLELNISKSVINRVTKDYLLHPYHLQKVQELLPGDIQLRLDFCSFINDQRTQDMFFHKKILFTDEACFTRTGISNIHNEHVYAEVNPHTAKVRHHQKDFRINVWAGIVDNFIVGPVILPDRLNGENYLNFLKNTMPELLEDLTLALRQKVWFMHDGAPPHHSVNVRAFLNQQYPNRWIGRGNNAPVQWPPRSPDMTPMDYFFWGSLKEKVYSTSVNNRDDLWQRIQQCTNVIRNDKEVFQRLQLNFLHRINLCRRLGGSHFEPVLRKVNNN
ncbi:uncharacterized protein [Euwallacea similis]